MEDPDLAAKLTKIYRVQFKQANSSEVFAEISQRIYTLLEQGKLAELDLSSLRFCIQADDYFRMLQSSKSRNKALITTTIKRPGSDNIEVFQENLLHQLSDDFYKAASEMAKRENYYLK